MNALQTVFTIFYGLYFAVTLTLTGDLQPFDTPMMYKLDRYAWFRCIVSFIMLNLLPLFYFVVIYRCLNTKELPNNLSSMFFTMLGILSFSIVGFGFYRLFWGVMLIKSREKYIFYGNKLPERLSEQLGKRDTSHGESMPHLLPGFLWTLIFSVLGILLA